MRSFHGQLALLTFSSLNAAEAFAVYVKSETGNSAEIPSFTDFINRYKKELSSFLSGKNEDIKSIEIDTSYLLHVKFLKHIELNNDVLYKIVEHIYIGVIIASYLEENIDLNTKPNTKVTYFLDTKIVLEALNLQNEEDTRPTKELLKLIVDKFEKRLLLYNQLFLESTIFIFTI